MKNAKGKSGPVGKPRMNLFRYRKVDSKYVVTNDHGAYIFLDDIQLGQLLSGKVKPGTPLAEELTAKGFLVTEANIDRIARDYERRVAFLYRGPILHIIVVTLRCNEVCRYCQASRASMRETETDMTVATADKVVDLIMRAPSDTLTIEFQGGEPLVNFEVVKRIVERSLAKAKEHGKQVMFSLVSNLSMMDEEKLAWILANRIQVSTSLDGPQDLHDHLRKLTGGSAYERTVYWMRRINEAYREAGLDEEIYRVEALPTITSYHLKRGRELVDEYLRQGCRAIFLRPLNPFGYAKTQVERLGYNGREFLDFYRETFDYILELNLKGVEILERLAAIFLTKILTPDDPNFMDIRSPCGAGIGQIAYNYDGSIFTCDEGRMVYQMGDEAFFIGHVQSNTYEEVVTHETVKALALASCLDSLPGCAACAYKPYCGTCPVFNYTEQGNIFPQNPTNDRCAIYMGVQDHLFRYLMEGNAKILEIFNRWVEVKDRVEYLHDFRRH